MGRPWRVPTNIPVISRADRGLESPVLLKITKKMPLLLGQPSEPDCQNINIRNMSWRLQLVLDGRLRLEIVNKIDATADNRF